MDLDKNGEQQTCHASLSIRLIKLQSTDQQSEMHTIALDISKAIDRV